MYGMVAEFESACILLLYHFSAEIVVFVTTPVNVSLAVNAITQIRCSAYVSSLNRSMNLSWINRDTNAAPSEEDGFSFHSESVETGGIQFVVTVLSFVGSAEPVTYPLACVAHVLNTTSSTPFTLSVVPEIGEEDGGGLAIKITP